MNDKIEVRDGREFYAGTGQPVWPRRYRELPSRETGQPKPPLIEDGYVRRLLERIETYEKKTRPSAGAASAADKDHAAFDALRYALELVAHIAGWAIDHQCGLAKENLEFLPLLDQRIKERPEYAQRKQLVDTHEHERVGALVRSGHAGQEAELARRVIQNILYADHLAVFPSWVSRDLRDALRKLDYGEPSPLFEPLKNSRKRDLTQMRLQLSAISMIAYRQGLGWREDKARELVADRMGQDKETLKSWRSRLRKEFGVLAVESAMQHARKDASWVLHETARRDRGETDANPETHSSSYNDTALKALSVAYHASLKD